MTYKKKLIEVALPLEAINAASAREKSIRHGHPSTLHLWWARRPLAACRAVLFAQLVDDPSAHPDQFPTEDAQRIERERLFKIIEDLVVWENSNNEQVLNAARAEILKSTNGNPPPVYDPFCGGGSIPLEAQRLGLEAYASDLNPVAVLITKAMIEIPPKFAGLPPVNPDARAKIGGKSSKGWSGAAGLAEDVRYYGKWMCDEAEKRIGKYYPKAKLPDGKEATVIAWLWARTVKCPNPACGCMMPLVRSFQLSTKAGKEAWVEPIIEPGNPPRIRFEVQLGRGKTTVKTEFGGTQVGRGGKFKCIACGTVTTSAYVQEEFVAKRNDAQLMALVAGGDKGRAYLRPTADHADAATFCQSTDYPLEEMNPNCKDLISSRGYGFKYWYELFTGRQLKALTTLYGLVWEARELVKNHALNMGMHDDGVLFEDGGTEAQGYSDAVSTYLTFAIDKGADYWSSFCSWHSGRDLIRNTFGRQAIPMVWDYAEGNPISDSAGSFGGAVDWVCNFLENLSTGRCGFVSQQDAMNPTSINSPGLISTDPPYYDNISYSDLSDYFYVWIRHALHEVHPKLLCTLLTPKKEELIVSRSSHPEPEEAKRFFEEGLKRFFRSMSSTMDVTYPATIYYAFKQAEQEADDENGTSVVSSTGWETMLEAILSTGYTIIGTWPMRTELSSKLLAQAGGGRNVLASSIVIVCRPRPDDAPITTRKDFLAGLKRELFPALDTLKQGNIAPVDFAQAAIGPGMAVFSRYTKVLDASGEPMRVRDALVLINQMLDEYLTAQEGEYDADTRWALAWFEQFQYNAGEFGIAETLSKAKNVSVGGLAESGILESKPGKVRLLERSEYPDLKDWDPRTDKRINAWEVTQRLIYALEKDGTPGAAKMLQGIGGLGETARELAYRLYSLCERKKWAKEALAYNSLVIAWPEIVKNAAKSPAPRQMGTGLGEG